jgi:putative methionine-R-sulfoxide reductase with GAF domain
MPESTGFEKSAAAAEIKSKLRLLNSLSGFLIIVLLSIVAASLYEPVRSFLPEVSIVAIIAIVLILTVVGVYLSRMLTKHVLNSIGGYSRKLDGMLSLTRELREEIYGDLLLEKIIDSAVLMTSSEAGYILLVEGENLVFKVARGIFDLSGKSFPKDKGMAGAVVKHGTPLFVEDVNSAEDFSFSLEGVADFPVTSAMCVPFVTKGEVIGVIELLNKSDGPYDHVDVEMVNYLSDQAASLIERATFYEDQKNYEIHITDVLVDTIDYLIPEKTGHSRRVARYAGLLSKAIKMSEDEQRRLYFASLLHDIGFLKLAHKEDFKKLNVERHVHAGYEFLNSINFYKDIAPFVLHHHERYDGSGYPNGLEGANIPLQSRIISIAEIFDKLACLHPDQTNYSVTLEELKEKAGTYLDPGLVKVFITEFKGTLE